MGVYSRGGWWYARKTVRRVEYRKALGTRSKRKADADFLKWAGSLEETRDESRTTTSFRTAVDIFTEHHLNTLKKNSQVRYLQSLLNLTSHFDGRTLQSIERTDLTGFVAARRKSGVSDPTIIRDLACLSSVYTIASDWGKAEINPVLPFLRMMKRRGHLVNSQARTRYLSHAEEWAILTRAATEARQSTKARQGEKWRIAAALMAYIDTGMRAQELLAMKWSWVDLARMEITVPKEVAKSSKDRVIPILPRTARLLRSIRENEHSEIVFWRTEGGRSFADLNHTLQRIAASAGVADVTIHDLRRTCGCRLLQDHKVSMEAVSRWLGHSSVTQTEKVYAFLSIDDLHDAVGTVRLGEDLKPKLACVDAELGAHPAQKAKRIGTMTRHNEFKLLANNG